MSEYSYTTEEFAEGVTTTIWKGDALFLDITGPDQEDKARVITRALNHFDEVVEALERAAGDLRITAEFLEGESGMGGTVMGIREDERRILNVLAKAREQTDE